MALLSISKIAVAEASKSCPVLVLVIHLTGYIASRFQWYQEFPSQVPRDPAPTCLEADLVELPLSAALSFPSFWQVEPALASWQCRLRARISSFPEAGEQGLGCQVSGVRTGAVQLMASIGSVLR